MNDVAFDKHKPILQGMGVKFPSSTMFTNADEWSLYLGEMAKKMKETMDELDKSDNKSPDLEQLESIKKNLKEQIKSLTKQINSIEQEDG